MVNTQPVTNDTETKAKALASRYRAWDLVAIATGCTLVVLADMLREFHFPQTQVWLLVAWFIPISTLLGLAALVSSTVMQSTLKTRGYPNPMSRRQECLYALLDAKDWESLDLFACVAGAGAVAAGVAGIGIGLCVIVTVSV